MPDWTPEGVHRRAVRHPGPFAPDVDVTPGEPLGSREYRKRNYGPTIAVHRANTDDPERTAALDAAFLESLTSRREPGAEPRWTAEYLLVSTRRV